MRALEWTHSGREDQGVLAWASRALSEGIFDSQGWFEALADDSNIVLRKVLVLWGKYDLTVGQRTSLS